MQDSSPESSQYVGITLIEVWDILARRRVWIVATLLVCLAAGVGYLMFKAPVYQAAVQLRIGQVAGAGTFEATEVLSSRLLARYGEEVADGVVRPRPFLRRVAPSKSAPAVLDLVAEGYKPEDASLLLDRVFAEIRKRHDEIFDRNVEILNDRLRTIEAQRGELQQQYADASSLMARLKHDNPLQASLIALERGRIAASISSLDAEKPDLLQRLIAPQTEPTVLLGEVIAPARPAFPRKAMIGALAVVLGLMLGVLLAFTMEFIATIRGQKPAEQGR